MSESARSRSRSPKGQGALKRTWVFTWNNYPDNWKDLFENTRDKLAGYVVGKEIAPTTGTPHLQGWVDFGRGKRGRWTQLKLPKEIHWSPAKGNASQNYTYCTKEGEFEVYGTGKEAKPVPEYKFVMEPTDWQLKLVDILSSDPDPRSVYWIWEPKGRAGKTSFQKWWVSNHDDTLVLSGKAADMKNGIVTWIEQHKVPPRTIFCNIPRSVEEKYVSFTGLEEVKDMLFYSGKYEGGMVNGASPHLIIFANWAPDTHNMSADRWKICRIKDGKGDGFVEKLDWTGALDE